jgi:dipeptidyl aminopeptidase/acylaminoacyl peptidase
MQRDLRETHLFQEAEAWYRALRAPATGQISDAAEVHVSSDGTRAVFSATLMDDLHGSPATRICQLSLATAEKKLLTFGPNTDRLPRYSPDGRHIAFLSDRHASGDFQLYLLSSVDEAVRAAPRVEGWVEYLHWSPDGSRILLGVAGHGADIAGGQGAITSERAAGSAPSWMPSVQTGDESYCWRRAWVYELATNTVRQASSSDENVWEANWCGNEALVAVVSHGPREGLWYTARLRSIDVHTGESRELHVPQDQLGLPMGSPSGSHVAVVEAICSDRWLVAGDLLLIESASGRVRRVDTHGVDVSCIEWRSDRCVLVAGHRGFDTVVGLVDAASQSFTETWGSREISTGGFFATVSGVGEDGDCVLVGEGFHRAPEIAVIRAGEYRPIRSFDLRPADRDAGIEAVATMSWNAPDGLEIQGWLLRPRGAPPHPLVLYIHGGPVWHWRPFWLGRRSVHVLMLLERGYAVFLPNPRGSAGRGQDFARRVVGDMGGADTHDYLSGVDELVTRGIADPARLGVTGGSYGGFMACWLITQDPRFAAAVPVAPVTNQVTEHLISNIPHFVSLFLADRFSNAGGKYFQRSPVMHAHKTRTPTLNICGALDRCTPPEEAMQFHNALLENGVDSVLVTYPEEGHGIRKFPAVIDYAARVVAWFEKHIPARCS